VSEQDDLLARLRALEAFRADAGERLAKAEIAVELARAVAPLVNDVATLRSADESFREDIAEIRQWQRDRDQEAKSARTFRITTALAVFTAVLLLCAFIFTILQFAGVGHG
jgi:hypothetical protein